MITNFFGIGLLTMFVDLVLPKRVIDIIHPFIAISVQRLLQHTSDTAYEHNLDHVALVSAIPSDVNVVVVSSEAANNICYGDITAINKATEAYEVLNVFGHNIVTTNGDEWTKHRKVCTAAFTKSNLKLVRTATVQQASKLIDTWKSRIKEGENSVVVTLGGQDELLRLTLGVFGEAIFGVEMNDVFTSTDASSLKTFCDRLIYSNDHLHWILVSPSSIMRWPFQTLERAKKAFDYLDKDMKEMLKAATAEGNDKKDLLSLLARANQRFQPLTSEESLADVWMFCVAGMETSAHTLGWLCMRLAFNQELQQNLYEEVQKIAPNFHDITMENSPYIFAFVHEVLRLDCPVNYVPMKSRKPTSIKSSNKTYEVPAGYIFNISITAIHTNENYHKNPNKFDPTRFIDADGNFFTPEGFLPFVIGPRACIGKQIALMELTIASSMIVDMFKITPIESLERSSAWMSKITREMMYHIPYKFELRKK